MESLSHSYVKLIILCSSRGMLNIDKKICQTYGSYISYDLWNMQDIDSQVKASSMYELRSICIIWYKHNIFYEICDVYNIQYNIQQIYNNKHQVDNIVQINSKRYIICLCYNIDMRPMNYCKIGKTFYTRCVVYKTYDNYIRFRTRMWYMTK